MSKNILWQKGLLVLNRYLCNGVAKIDFAISADLCSAIKRQTQYAKEQECHDTLPDS